MDIEELREYLIDYCGTALSYNPNALEYLARIENANDEELIDIAEELGINLDFTL